MERNTALRRFQVIVLSGFAAVSLMLAALGLYVSLRYMVVERIPKLGLRLALGARRTDLLGLVMRRGMALSAMGLAVGLIASAALTRFVQSVLYATHSLPYKKRCSEPPLCRRRREGHKGNHASK
jgi:putative ABC transport system permease protein